MSDQFSLVADIPDFRRQLREVERRVGRRAVSQGVRDAGKIFRDTARQLAPVLRTPAKDRIAGTLRRSIVIARTRRAPRGTVSYSVVVRAASQARRGTARDPYYWRWLEGGWIPRGPGQRLRGGVESRKAQRARSTGARVQYPFLEPAFRRASGAALAAFNRGVASRLPEAQAVT